MANIQVKTVGVRGGNPKIKNEGQIVLFIDEPKAGCYIYADAYIGQGTSYRERDNTILEIREDYNVLFSGSFKELCKKLNTIDRMTEVLTLVLKEKYRESNDSIQNTEIEDIAEELIKSIKS